MSLNKNPSDIQYRYWQKLNKYVENHSRIKCNKIEKGPRIKLTFNSLLADMHLAFKNSPNEAIVRLHITNKEFYTFLFNQKETIEKELNQVLNWNSPYENKDSYNIELKRDIEFYNESKWQEYIEWHVSNAEKFIEIFFDKIDEFEEDIKQIRTLTLSDTNQDSLSYDDAVNFLSDVLINERDCHYHYFTPFNLLGKTLVLFKYKGKLIGKGIIMEKVSEKVIQDGDEYNGYYIVDKDSISIFKEPVGLEELNKYITIRSLSRDQIIDLKYLNEVNKMIEDQSNIKNEYEIPVCVIRNYLAENNLGDLTDTEKEEKILEFQNKFSPEKLKELEGMDVLNAIFLHDGDTNNLCYTLEFSKECNFAGGIGGGTAYKYFLFKKNETHQWTSGSSRHNKILDEAEAIAEGTKIRDALVSGADLIENYTLNTVSEYENLERELDEIFSNCGSYPINSWVHKYYSLLFPEKFPIIHQDHMKKEMLRKFRIAPEKSYYAKDCQLKILAEKSGIKLYSLFSEPIIRLFFVDSERIWDDTEFGRLTDLECGNTKPFESDLKRNIIYFGAPGTGKSYNLNKDKGDMDYERVTFHPDYSYANFVGTYKPVPKEESITYTYVPGPFMRSLVKAYKNPEKPFLLIIEEINRSNVAAVFGDVFQLLDRNEEHVSMYPVNATEDMKKYIKSELKEDIEEITLPSNLFIWATMNSADQGVFPMDTAFKRRWDFKYFSINTNEELIENTRTFINGEEISWNNLRKQINEELLSYKINEDKLMGPFFAFNEFMNETIPEETFKDIFKNKIIMYLFEDAAKSRRNELFSGVGKKYVTYSDVCEAFDQIGIRIFNFFEEDE